MPAICGSEQWWATAIKSKMQCANWLFWAGVWWLLTCKLLPVHEALVWCLRIQSVLKLMLRIHTYVQTHSDSGIKITSLAFSLAINTVILWQQQCTNYSKQETFTTVLYHFQLAVFHCRLESSVSKFTTKGFWVFWRFCYTQDASLRWRRLLVNFTVVSILLQLQFSSLTRDQMPVQRFVCNRLCPKLACMLYISKDNHGYNSSPFPIICTVSFRLTFMSFFCGLVWNLDANWHLDIQDYRNKI